MNDVKQSRGPRKRHWCFTYFGDLNPVRLYVASQMRYVCAQREISAETKRLHYQGYVEFFDNKRLGQCQSLLGKCHFEPRKGTRFEAREYCHKILTSVPGSFEEKGLWRTDPSRKRKLADMLLSNMTLPELIEASPIDYVRCHRGLEKLYARRKKKQAKKFRKVEVLVLVGKTGSGKTRRACEEEDYYMMPTGDKIWFDGYEGEKTLIIDDFYGNIKYGLFLRILDGHILPLPIKGGFVWALWTKVIITSNERPHCWYTRGFTDAMKRRIVPDKIVILD